LLSAPIYYHRIAVPVDTDYGSHVAFAQQILDPDLGKGVPLSHPILQYILIGLHLGSGRLLGLYASLMVLQVLVQVFTALIIYFWIGPAEQNHWDWLRAGAAISLTFVAPIMLLAFRDGLFYYGYIGLANYHNPTIHLLKPFALLSLIFASRAVSNETSRWGTIGMAAALMVLATWIKPNYSLAILPALGLVVGIRLLQRMRLDWKMLAFGFYLPGVAILLIQWLIDFQDIQSGTGIIFAPFTIEGSYSGFLAIKFLLSTFMPLLVLVIARRRLLQDPDLLVASAGFIVGAAQFYLLAESGDRMYHANFRWSGQIMLFLLFVVTVRWYLRQRVQLKAKHFLEKILVYGMYLAHLIAGVVYYIYCMVSIHYR